MLRRLSRNEYANTLRDLLGIHINAADGLPIDGGGGEGFDNAAETLFISPIHAEKYLDAARDALSHAIKDPRSRGRLIIAEPSEELVPQQAAEQVLATFLPRAFRRPVDAGELQQYVQLFDSAYRQDRSYQDALQMTLAAALVSPKFLMLSEAGPPSAAPALLSDYELASRLSYFLWSSMPDGELMQLAAAGKLQDDEVLQAQVVRMLSSPIDGNGLRRGTKVRAFATNFTEQWLGIRVLGSQWKPDKTVIKRFDSELAGGMKYEPIFFMEELLADNRSLLNLIDSDFTYLNRRLANHYKIRGQFREQPKRVELPAESHRGGLLGMSAVLAVSSYPHRTSPVLRGKWILEKLLGTPPPPPPPDVGELEEPGAGQEAASLRERLMRHRADATCASCHEAMDPLGFGLENYDALGRWRTEIDDLPVDARGELPGGPEFEGPGQLKHLLMDRKDQFIRHLTAKNAGVCLGTRSDRRRCLRGSGNQRQAGQRRLPRPDIDH